MDEGRSNETRNTSEDSETEVKPFKKAKYAWQIKGKARWKKKLARNRNIPVQEIITNRGSSKVMENEKIKEQSNVPIDVIESQEVAPSSGEKVNENVTVTSANEAPCGSNLHKWQTKQMAKAIIDNAINKVLEDMGFIPLPADAFDFHLVDSDINTQNIEDKGVSEAIKQQGLHRRHHLPESRTTCTCWLHWNSNEEAEQHPVEPEQENVLDTAVSFAISEKGLGMFSSDLM